MHATEHSRHSTRAISFAILCRGEPWFKRHFSALIHSALIACSNFFGIDDNGQGKRFICVACLAFGMRLALLVRAIDICSISASIRCNREASLSPVPVPAVLIVHYLPLIRLLFILGVATAHCMHICTSTVLFLVPVVPY